MLRIFFTDAERSAVTSCTVNDYFGLSTLELHTVCLESLRASTKILKVFTNLPTLMLASDEIRFTCSLLQIWSTINLSNIFFLATILSRLHVCGSWKSRLCGKLLADHCRCWCLNSKNRLCITHGCLKTQTAMCNAKKFLRRKLSGINAILERVMYLSSQTVPFYSDRWSTVRNGRCCRCARLYFWHRARVRANTWQ